jgi:predicted secreted protein
VLRFKALQSGTTTLKLGYSRSFEPDVAPIEEFTLTIEVK